MANTQHNAVFKFDNLREFSGYIRDNIFSPFFKSYIDNQIGNFSDPEYYSRMLADPELLDFLQDYIYNDYQEKEYPVNREIYFDLEDVVFEGIRYYVNFMR